MDRQPYQEVRETLSAHGYDTVREFVLMAVANWAMSYDVDISPEQVIRALIYENANSMNREVPSE